MIASQVITVIADTGTQYPALFTKPSDIAVMFILVCMVLFIFGLMARASKRAEKSGNESGFGVDVALSFVALIILTVIAIGLITVFQAMYPGQ